MEIYLSRNGTQAGPYSTAQMAEQLRAGALPDDTFYWTEGCEGWLPISAFPGWTPSHPAAVTSPPLPSPPVQVPTKPRRARTLFLAVGAMMLLAAVGAAGWWLGVKRTPTPPDRVESKPKPALPHRPPDQVDREYDLSERSRHVTGNLHKPVRLIIHMTASTSPLLGDVLALTKEYRDTNPASVSLERVDPAFSPERAKEIEDKYKLVPEENVVVLDDGEGHIKIIPEDKMVDIDRSGAEPKITGFTGEQAITSALLEVTEGKRSIIYDVQGHGEEAVGAGKGLTTLGTLFDNDHLATAEVNLLNVQAVPADASLLIFFGPKYDVSEREVKLLTDYWDQGGRILILLNPEAATPKLAGFLNGVGIKPDDDRLIGARHLEGNLIGIIRDSYLNATGSTPIAQALAGITLVFPGATQSLTLDTARVAPANIHVEPLLQALPGFWGEVDYKNIEEEIKNGTGVYFDEGRDKAAPLYVAASVQKGALGDKRVQTNAARMIVIGNTIFVGNESLTEESANFFLSSIDWLQSQAIEGPKKAEHPSLEKK